MSLLFFTEWNAGERAFQQSTWISFPRYLPLAISELNKIFAFLYLYENFHHVDLAFPSFIYLEEICRIEG